MLEKPGYYNVCVHLPLASTAVLPRHRTNLAPPCLQVTSYILLLLYRPYNVYSRIEVTAVCKIGRVRHRTYIIHCGQIKFPENSNNRSIAPHLIEKRGRMDRWMDGWVHANSNHQNYGGTAVHGYPTAERLVYRTYDIRTRVRFRKALDELPT